MRCPKCGARLHVTHTYNVEGIGRTQRLDCRKCALVAVTKTEIVEINPGFGQGAAALAKRLRSLAEPNP